MKINAAKVVVCRDPAGTGCLTVVRMEIDDNLDEFETCRCSMRPVASSTTFLINSGLFQFQFGRGKCAELLFLCVQLTE